MVTTSPPRTLADWIDLLVEADTTTRRQIAIDGLEAGIGYRKVFCERHKVGLNWQSAYRHLERTEGSHKLQHPDAGPLHVVGDLRPLQDTWETTTCNRRGCAAKLIWASTGTGGAIAVDAEPNPAGNVVLARPISTDRRRPLAVFVHTEAARSATSADSLYMPHASTCNGRPS